MEIAGIVGLVFAAAAIGGLVYEHNTDVLRGPYIEGRAQLHVLAPIVDQVRSLVTPIVDRINWKARDAIYLASLA
jgi:hypothetical protein